MNTDLKDKLTEVSGQYANDKNGCSGPIGDRHGGNGTGFRHLCLSVFACGFLVLCVLGVSVVKCQAGWQTGPAVSGGGGGTATNATLNIYTTNLTGVADAHVETLTVAGATSAVDAATATNALNLGGVAVSSLISQYQTSWVTNQMSAWWSADTIQANSGATVSTWRDRFGNVFTGTATYDAEFENGRPAVTFNGVNQFMTNVTVTISSNFVSSGTLILVFRCPRIPAALGGQCKAFVVGTNGAGLYGVANWIFSPFNIGGGSAVTQPNLCVEGNDGQSGDVNQFNVDFMRNDDTHVFCCKWVTNTASYLGYQGEVFIDGKCIFNSTNNYLNYNYAGFIGFSGPMAIGTDFYTIWNGYPDWFNGGFSEILMSTNAWTESTIDQASQYFMAKYGTLKPVVVTDGDSIIMRGQASYGGTFQEYMCSNLTGVAWIDAATFGETSYADYSNALIWARSGGYANKKIAMLMPSGYNDVVHFGTNVAVGILTNNLISESSMLQSNGWKTILLTPISNFSNDVSCVRGQYANWATNCWQQNFDGIVNFYNDPLIGASNAWTNMLYFYSDGVHLTNAGYAEMAADAMPVLNNVLYGTQSNGTALNDCLVTNTGTLGTSTNVFYLFGTNAIYTIPNPALLAANAMVTFWRGTTNATPILTNGGTLFEVPGYGEVTQFPMGGTTNVVTLMVHAPAGNIATNNWGCQ